MRTEEEINEAKKKYFYAVWLERYERKEHQKKLDQYLHSGDAKKVEIAKGASAKAKKLHEVYSDDPEFNIHSLDNTPEHEAYMTGFVNGKLSTLRWVMGGEWDQLYT